jgi:hypothetical protein
MTLPETNGQSRSLDPSTVLREMVDERQVPDDREAPADEESRPPWPDDADRPQFTFAELIDHEALGYQAWGTPVGAFLASEMEKLARLIRWTKATTPEEHEGRMEIWDDEIGQRWEAIGYEEGLRTGRAECPHSGPID